MGSERECAAALIIVAAISKEEKEDKKEKAKVRMGEAMVRSKK